MVFGRTTLLLSFAFFSAVKAQAGKLYYTDREADLVRRANLDGSDVETLIELPDTNLRGIVIHRPGGKLYFCDNARNTIYRADLDGGNLEAIVENRLRFPADITIDSDSQKLYWCDRTNNRIERANLDGSGRETVLETSLPYFLDLDPAGGKIYWGHFQNGTIKRANLADGSDEEVVIDNLTTVRQVKLDLSGGYLYWCDRNAKPARIQRRRIEGGEIEDLYLGLDTPHGMDLDIPAGKIYWVDTGTNARDDSIGARSVCRGNMDGSGPVEILAEGDQPWDIVLDPTVSDYIDWRQRHLPAGAKLDGPADDIDGDGVPNGIAYALGGSVPSFCPGSPAFEYDVRNGVSDLFGLRIEVSTDLQSWRHNNDGGALVTDDFPSPGLPGDPFQHFRSELRPPFDTAERVYLRVVLP
ncbi:MAG: DUF5050 domain-containing protein [Akkermansiaceae bacterium]